MEEVMFVCCVSHPVIKRICDNAIIKVLSFCL